MYTDKNETREEWLPLVDAEGNVIGKETRSRCHNGSRKLHPVVHLHVVDSEGRIYLQLRPEWKTVQPGKWDTAVGGHVDFGETVGEALIREAYEELNLSGFTPGTPWRLMSSSPRPNVNWSIRSSPPSTTSRRLHPNSRGAASDKGRNR